MTSLLSSIFCCAGNCLCHCCNNICSDSMKINPKLFSRIGYIILSLISVGFSLIILFFGANILKPFDQFIHCPAGSEGDKFDCLGVSSVYRMSLALALVHLVIIIFSLISKQCAKVLNQECWSFKILFIIVLYFSFFFISNKFFIIYAEIAKYLSIIFLLYQVLVTIGFAHILNLELVEGWEQAEEKNKGTFKYNFALIVLTLIFGGLAIYWIVDSFIHYSDGLLNIVIICLTVLFGFGFTFVSISNLVNRKRLLTSVYIFSFVSYLCWSALNSKPDTSGEQIKISFEDIGIGLVYLFMALCFLGFYVKKSNSHATSSTSSYGANAEKSEAQAQLNKNPLIETESKY